LYIGENAFIPIEGRAAAINLFKMSVQRVEIETHSYCNRRCDYCPNSIGDRLGPNIRMEDAIWQRIINDLGEIEYDSIIALNSYNEPLADRFILERLRQVRVTIPKAKLWIYTNGDYLDADYLNDLADAGLDVLSISVHLNQGEKFNAITMLNKFSELSVRMGCPAIFKEIVGDRHVLAQVRHPRLTIELRGINFFESGTNRGNMVEGIKVLQPRTMPCYFPFAHFIVGYSGNIVPCCHIRSDAHDHQQYVIGEIGDFESIFQAYASRRAVKWRRHLISFDEKKEPCRSCSVAFLTKKPEELEMVRRAHRQHVYLSGDTFGDIEADMCLGFL
jgi:radical SAM protein with 4Fe4S-binding SPASM domain